MALRRLSLAEQTMGKIWTRAGGARRSASVKTPSNLKRVILSAGRATRYENRWRAFRARHTSTAHLGIVGVVFGCGAGCVVVPGV